MKGRLIIIVSYFCFTEGVLAQETVRNVTKFRSRLRQVYRVCRRENGAYFVSFINLALS